MAQVDCVDFRRLNNLPEPDHFPVSRIDTLFARLGGARFTTKLGMTKAYFQVSMAPQDRPLKGFVTSKLHFQWRHMAFALRNAPTTFKGLEDFCEAYLDGVIVFSKTWQNHVTFRSSF